MLLGNTRHFNQADPAGGGQPNAAGEPKPTFDRSALPPFLQKYPGNSMEEVLKAADTGYWNMVNQTKEVLNKVDPLTKKAAAYDALQAQLGNNTSAQKTAVDMLAEELGIADAGLLRRALGEVVQPEAAKVFGNAFAPIVGEFTATEELAAEIGDEFVKIKPQVQKWLSENADEKKWFEDMRAAYPRQAWELAIRRWGATQPAGGARNKSAAAAIHGGQPSAARGESSGPNPEALKAAAQINERFGDWRPLVHERARGTSIEAAVAAMNQQLGVLGNL